MISSFFLTICCAFWTLFFTLAVRKSDAFVASPLFLLVSVKRAARPSTWLCSFSNDDDKGSFLGNNHDLPLQQYKEAINEFENILVEAIQSLDKLKALSNVMQSIELRDPDILAATAEARFDSHDMDDNDNDNAAISGDRPTRSRSYMTALEEAVQQALNVSKGTGRSSLETELAWYTVDRLNQQLPRQQQHALLSHPSFRYNYGQHMLSSLLLSKTSTLTLSPSRCSLQQQTSKAKQNLDQLKEIVDNLQHHLIEQERTKKEYLARLMGSNFL